MIRIKSSDDEQGFISQQTIKKIRKVKAFIVCYMSQTVRTFVLDYLCDWNTGLPGIHIFKFALLRKKCMQIVEERFSAISSSNLFSILSQNH